MADLRTFLVECEAAELAVRDLYLALAKRFADAPRAGELFGRLAQEEENHARSFRMLQSLAAQAEGKATVRANLEAISNQARQALEGATRAVQRGHSLTLARATELVIRIEGSALEAQQTAFAEIADPGFRQILEGITAGDRNHGWLLEELRRYANEEAV